jgi:hypothetical protein
VNRDQSLGSWWDRSSKKQREEIAKNSRSLPIIWYSALLPHDQIELGLVHFFPIQSIVIPDPIEKVLQRSAVRLRTEAVWPPARPRAPVPSASLGSPLSLGRSVAAGPAHLHHNRSDRWGRSDRCCAQADRRSCQKKTNRSATIDLCYPDPIEEYQKETTKAGQPSDGPYLV